MAKAKIVYCSMTGNTQACAEIIYDKLVELGLDTESYDCTTVEADIFEDADLIIVGTYTYGEGDMPDEIIDFYEDLQDMDLSGKIFGAFGSGDTFYGEHFCQNVKDFDRVLEASGATRGAEHVEVELYPEDESVADLERFAEELASKLQ